MMLTIIQKFYTPAHGGGERYTGQRSRSLVVSGFPPKGSIIKFGVGDELSLPDDVEVVYNAKSGEATYTFVTREGWYDSEKGQLFGTSEEDLEKQAKDDPEWSYDIESWN